ncbi:unannotated protein [freshwater metagenome]|uniref:Unannotated protein n=1 Tax=freshwater metagenome TaxID=449393 RepID=A0A6J7EDY4_9ZZZZ|nr:hypothetical protein [Actinomycetota bacterium]
MSLEERTIEPLGDHCEVCGTQLTQAELEDILQTGGPVLCAIHADDLVEDEDEDEDGPA